MAFRIKSKWFKRDTDQLDESLLKENGEALAFISWRLALDKAINLHGEDFTYDNDQQRVYVIGEYLSFMIQVADRHVYKRLSDDARMTFISEYARRLSEHMQDNCIDLFGNGDYKSNFIEMINVRAAGYAEFEYSDKTGPSYNFMHYFGTHVQKVMSDEHHVNKWVIDQVMEIDGPEVMEKQIDALDNLFDY